MKNLIIILSVVAVFAGFSGCAVGPKFRAPEITLPDTYRYSLDTASVNNLSRWWTAFNDPILDTLINRAFAQNKNLASAVKNIELAQMAMRDAKSQLLPSIGLSGTAEGSYNSATRITQNYSAQPTISWDIDLWGKIRRQAEAAGAAFKATEYEVAAIGQTLATEVATTYFTAISYKKALQIAHETYSSRERSERLMDSMYYYGAISQVDLQQAKASLATAGAAVSQYQRALDQSVMSLNLLLGQFPSPTELGEFGSYVEKIPSGVPSSLLERRPDVMQAYYSVQQANALIGVAVAERLPSISLTGEAGLARTIAEGIVTAKPPVWSAAASLIAPILSWGKLRRNELSARIRTQQAVLAYENSVLTAIHDVEKALVAVSTYNQEVTESNKMVESSIKADRLTGELYRSGSTSYLDVLDANRTLFAAQLQNVQTITNQIISYITLYKALGGGWQ